jgi:hypothetical protein
MRREIILKYLLPIIIDGVTLCSRETKKLIARQLAWLLKTVSFSNLRQQIHDTVIKKFSLSSNFQDRLFYIEFCYCITELMSKQYFKEHFLSPLNSLWTGKTTEELYKLCLYAPIFKKALLINDAEQASLLMGFLKDYSTRTAKKYRFINEVSSESLKVINSLTFMVSDITEKELICSELAIKKAEKKEIEEAKKLEIELLIKQARLDVMSKIPHSVKTKVMK